MAEVGVRAWRTWEPWGLPMAYGMALDMLLRHGPWTNIGRWSKRRLSEQLDDEQRFPNNKFIKNARLADALITIHMLGCAMPVHDRPMHYAVLSGACERPDGGLVQPHALWAMIHG